MKTNNIRYMTFGKYKGIPILQVIAEHIGYIMWCFENIDWFKLNDVEQKFYDWQAIAIKKYSVEMIFPVDLMYKHIKDRKALETLTTPYVFHGADPFLPTDTEISEQLYDAGVFKRSAAPVNAASFASVLEGLQHTTMKEIDNMSEEEIDEMVSMGLTPPIIW